MKNIILTILSGVVLVSCDNQRLTEQPDVVEVAYYYDEEEHDGYEDIDLTASVNYYTSNGNLIYISRDSYGNISGHDMNGNFYSAYTDDYGNTTVNIY
ncbi:hypothetical protein [uncultured Muribaculum sp.]|uniref:hypothetical protein n=1 Tax=uncultured Muribaculum sp. TaxID=1918613 RepID=UPI002730DCDA|nr:hypothetical protein [uncultured Muribaculum sp.]